MESSKQQIATTLDLALNNVNKNTRKILEETFNDKIFVPVYDISLRNSKELALERLKKVISTKVVSIRDFQTNPENIFTVHEMVTIYIRLIILVRIYRRFFGNKVHSSIQSFRRNNSRFGHRKT